MGITKYPPNTIWLGGHRIEIGDLIAGEAITPGHLVERYVAGGVIKWRKQATAGSTKGATFATEQSMLNKSVDDAYAAGDLVEVTMGAAGTNFWGIIASGANITAGDVLECDGAGRLRAAAVAGSKRYVALETKDNTAGPGDARLRVEVQ
jgi:hypothetical protein